MSVHKFVKALPLGPFWLPVCQGDPQTERPCRHDRPPETGT